MQGLFKRYKKVIIIAGVFFLFRLAGELTTYYGFKFMDDCQVISGSYNRALSDSIQNALLHTKIKFAEIKVMVYDSVTGSIIVI